MSTFQQLIDMSFEDWEEIEGAEEREYWEAGLTLFDGMIDHIRQNLETYRTLWGWFQKLQENMDTSMLYDSVADVEYKLSGSSEPITFERFEKAVKNAREFYTSQGHTALAGPDD
jgi:hypothetical protein